MRRATLYRGRGRRLAPRLLLLLTACSLIAGAPSPALVAQEMEEEHPSGYKTYEDLTTMLQTMADHHPEITNLESLGRTLEGRDIWMLQVANPAGVPVEQRPALMVAANFEGNQVIGSELALATAHRLLHDYGSDETVTALVDEHAFYFVPRVNPDGAERFFAAVKFEDRRNSRPYDDDNDGRIDEDGPEDINGDGMITQMRVEEPSGAFMQHPDDPRLMKRAEPAEGESGSYSIYWEGTDEDDDGFYNEDGPGGVDLNRNFQHEYPYYEADAGPHMVSEHESRALLDFVVAHRNIAIVLTYGESDNLVQPPNQRGELAASSPVDLWAFADESFAEAGRVGMYTVGWRRRGFRGFGFPGGFRGVGQQQVERRRPPAPRPVTTVDHEDQPYFAAVSERYKEISGVDRVAVTRAPKGAFFEYAYFQFGVPGFSTPGWGFAAEEADRPRQGRGDAGGGTDLRVLQALDVQGVEAFVEWAPVQHPQLGTVEVGGFRPYALTNPDPALLEDLGAKHADFALYLASLFAEVRFVETEVFDQGGGIFKIFAEVENAGYLPTALAQGVRARSVANTMVQLQIAPDDLVSGSPKTTFFRTLAGSGSRESFTWVIRGERGDQVELRLRSQKGGHDSVMLTLR